MLSYFDVSNHKSVETYDLMYQIISLHGYM